MSVRLTIFESGHCVQSEALAVPGGKWRRIRFPAGWALIEHPVAGPVLFDTGYSGRIFDVTARLPYALYPALVPVTVARGEEAVSLLAARGIGPGDIRLVFISHFHADHISGLADFPRATYRCLEDAWCEVRGHSGVRATAKGFLPGLLPADFTQRLSTIGPDEITETPDSLAPFLRGVDLLGDGSVWGVPLPGHAAGQLGLFVDAEVGPALLVADAVWSCSTYRGTRLPHRLGSVAHHDRREQAATVEALAEFHLLHPEIRIVPSHCAEITRERE